MKKKNILKIDLDQWQTQKDFATENVLSPQVVQNWVKRGRIKILEIPELSITLVAKKQAGEAPAFPDAAHLPEEQQPGIETL